MAITKAATSGVVNGAKTPRVSGGGGGSNTMPWQRPLDWLTLPTVNIGDQKVVGLFAVFPSDNNWVGITCSGAYTVDWGDGSSPVNVNANTKIEKNITYASVSGLTSRGYRQCIITITPQGAGNLTSVNVAALAAPISTFQGVSQWLDVKMAAPSLTSLTLRTNNQMLNNLRQFEFVGTSSLTSGSQLFRDARQLVSLRGTAWTSGMTSMSGMFQFCASLETIPLLNTSANGNFDTMFQGCSSLKDVPLLDISTGFNFNQTFNSCISLRTVPRFNLAAATTVSSMFQSCSTLQSVPLFLGLTVCTNFNAMFSTCPSLETIPLFYTGAGTNFSAMFQNCNSLQTIPLLDTAAGTNFGGMFNNCSALIWVPLLNVGNGGAATFSTMFTSCPSLQRGAVSGTKGSIDYSGARLTGAELDLIYTNLASGVTGQTITVTSNIGTGSDTPSIATAKGWTVTGS